MNAIRNTLALACLCAAGLSPAVAQVNLVTNGNFSNGFTGWTSVGDAAVVNGRARLTTASLTEADDASLPAGFNNVSDTTSPVDFFFASDVAGVSLGNLDAAGGLSGAEASAIRQDFFATQGDVLNVTFQWAFLSTESISNPMSVPDFAFISANDSVIKFVDAFSPVLFGQFQSTLVPNGAVVGTFSNAAATWTWYETAYSYQALQTGNVSFVIGVVDVVDALRTSELRVDNISISAVPEPETYAMLLAGLGLMGAVARRRKLG